MKTKYFLALQTRLIECLLIVYLEQQQKYSSTCHERTPSGPGKCPYMTGGHSSEGRVGGAKRNTPYTTTSPPAILILNTMSGIVIIMYAIVIESKMNTS